jgi:hypothetical protein
MRRVLVSVLLCGALMFAGPAAEAGDHWIGSWKLNEAKSKGTGGVRAQTLKFEATADGMIALSSEGVDAEGKPTKGSYTAKFDGTDVPWAGNELADTASPKRVDDNTYENTWKKGGAKFSSVAVYDRQ